MSRRASRLLVAAVFAALVTPVAAGASLSLRGIDTSGYPTVRVMVVAPIARTAAPPTLTENGNQVVGLHAVNLAATKSVVIAIDRSRSMAGTKLADALDAARAFLRTKAPSDKVSVVGFGSKAVQLTPFTQSTAEADDALRLLTVDSKNGTALYDALQLSSSSLRTQLGRARVVVLLTDGKDVSSQTSLKDALATAHDTGTLVYPIAIGGDSATVAPLQQMATVTGGSFKSAATSASLNAVYSSIASELKRTWRVEYVTSARPGEQLHLRVALDPEGAASTDVRIPGSSSEDAGGSCAAEPALLTARRAAADHARRLPRAHRVRVRALLGQGLVGQDPPRPARRALAQDAQAPEGRAPRRARRPLPRDRAGVRPPAHLAQAAAQCSSGPTCRCARSSSPT